MESRIEYRERRGGPRVLWGIRVGTRREIDTSARGLLAELREEHPTALVYVGRRRIRLKGGER